MSDEFTRDRDEPIGEGKSPGEEISNEDFKDEAQTTSEPTGEVGSAEASSSADDRPTFRGPMDDPKDDVDPDDAEENEKSASKGEKDSHVSGVSSHVDVSGDVNSAEKITTHRRDTFNASRDINIGSSEKPEFGPLSSAVLHKLSAVFVAPPQYETVYQVQSEIKSKRIVLVHGADHSGRWSCAVRLADDLAADAVQLADDPQVDDDESPAEEEIPALWQYMRPRNSELPLINVVSAEDFPPKSIVLLRDCFERNIRHEELEPSHLPDLSEALLNKESILIMTGEGVHLPDLGVAKLAAEIPDLHEVFRRHLEYWASPDSQEEWVLTERQLEEIKQEKVWLDLSRFLTMPFHIHQFCTRLTSLSPGLEGKWLLRELKKVAREVAAGGRQAMGRWFNGLPPNDQFFGMLVVLFVGAKRRWLEQIYRYLVTRLRADQLQWLSDPRELGLEDARERLRLVELGKRLEPEDKVYERAILRQIENRQHLIWEALAPLSGLESLESTGDWSEPWKRQALGVALARVGRHDPEKLLPILNGMAADDDHLRAVVAGYALQELVREESGGDLVFKTLESWIHSRNPRKMWTAGAALWRVYFAVQTLEARNQRKTLKKEVFSSLQSLRISLRDFDVSIGSGRKESSAEIGQQREILGKKIWESNFHCIVDAMRQIALSDPEPAGIALEEWLSESDLRLIGLGCATMHAVFESFSRHKRIPNNMQRKFLLRLFSPLLGKAASDSIDIEVVLLTVRGWLRWPEMQVEILSMLMQLATSGDTQQRERLRQGLKRFWLGSQPGAAQSVAVDLVQPKKWLQDRLGKRDWKQVEELMSFWCEGTEAAARGIAQKVIARSYAVDGVLPSLPGIGPGIVIVDTTLLVASQEASSNAVWSLLALLDSRLDTTLLRLGEGESIFLREKLSECELVPRFAGHLLLMPALEALSMERKASTFVVAARKPHDFEDLLALPWLREIFYVGPRDEVEADTGEAYIHLELAWPPSRESLEEVCASLETHWARELASGSADLWWELLSTFGLDDQMEPPTQLEICAASLGELPTAQRPHDDPVWKALVLSLWWAAADLPACLSWIRAWLVEEADGAERPQKRVIACAASYALIRLYTAYPPDESGEGRAPALLFDVLAEPLGRQGSDGVDAVVRLVTHWLEDRDWAQHLAGGVQEGRGRLQRWAEEFLDDRPDLASQWTKQLADLHTDQEVEQSWSALAAVMDRLKARQALKHPDRLPDLGPHQHYLLLVVDAGATYKHLANVTANLYRQLVGHDDEDQQGQQVDLVPVVYRLGECRPFWAAKEEELRAEDLLPRAVRLPRLVGPLLQASETIREQVVATLLVTSTKPIDLEDWIDSPWWDKVKLYGSAATSDVADFNTLPKPTILPGRGVSGGSITIEAGRLVDHLASMRLPADEA